MMLDSAMVWVGASSPVATALAMFYLVFTGRLYVRSAHDAVVRVLENQLIALSKERDTWRDSSLAKDQTIGLLTSTNAKFLESARFSDHVMSALQEAGGKR